MVTNRLEVPVVVELSQYRAADGSRTVPAQFTPHLLVGTTTVSLGPGENTQVQFDTATGGYWVRWRQVGSPLSETTAATLDLPLDRLTIVVTEHPPDDAKTGGRGV